MRSLFSSSAAVVVAAFGLSLGACSSDPAAPADDPGARLGAAAAGGTAAAGGSPTGSGGTTGALPPGLNYPAGPYGIVVGSTIADIQFRGLRNPKNANFKFEGEKVEIISLHDFYNPTKDLSRPRALLVAASAGWCGPCRLEAAESMANYRYWQPRGAEFLTTLFDGETAGTPATPADGGGWAKDFKLEYPVVTDPNQKMGAYANLQAVPFNLVLDLTTMKIVYAQAAVFDSTESSPTLTGLLE